jgi:endonuclease/exonuclease/phosphatase (EEP) superfamily protein YafD
MTTPAAATTLTVMTYNVGNGLAPPDRLVAHLGASGADIIGLQELDVAQAVAIERGLSDLYPYLVRSGRGFAGRGLLSRFPLREHSLIDLVPGRPDLRAVIEVGSRALTVVVAHPPPPRLAWRGISFDRAIIAQIERLTEDAVAAAPALLVGDFNLTARHPMYARMTASGLIDAFRVAGTGRGLTFPVRPGRMNRINHGISWLPLPPVARIDYVWHTSDLTTEAAWVGVCAGSDHLPVLARVGLPATAGDTPAF